MEKKVESVGVDGFNFMNDRYFKSLVGLFECLKEMLVVSIINTNCILRCNKSIQFLFLNTGSRVNVCIKMFLWTILSNAFSKH